MEIDAWLYDSRSRVDDELELNFPHESHGNNWCFKSIRHPIDADESKIRVVSCADGLVLLCHESSSSNESIRRYYIGNPLLSQWTLLPSPPILPGNHYNDSGLVTRMHDGVILGYKVVRLYDNIQNTDHDDHSLRTLGFEIYSSDTGEWSYKQVSCPGGNGKLVMECFPITLNGKLYWHAEGMDGIVVYDFFSDDDNDDQARSIRLPDRMQRFHPHHSDSSRCFALCPCQCYKMICTTSQGFFVFVEAGRMTGKEESYNVKVWRLIKSDHHSWVWEKAWEINMASVGIGFESVPMAINNFDVDIIYLWSIQHRRYIAFNVRTQTKYLGPSNHDDTHNRRCLNACFYPRNTLTQFVLSLQEVPKMFSK
ncbi:unnamed protein product [Eruca vesicaria subsp. sativa]|uniref:F-box protein At3g26010-like beta-propeller domain-containing protein n=1 Tax=Eruca vesicaria subsp. sativa TaxID=29727 RepID=A0ABC8K4Z7_ERUVS|nr:unnamed protein product [Eruca vesicaria subsp. sativa]